jgi:cytochrome P450
VEGLPRFVATGREYLEALFEAQRACGDLFVLELGKSRQLVVASPALAYETLARRADAYGKVSGAGGAAGLKAVLGDGLLTAPDGACWAERRRLVQPAFQRAAVARWQGACARVIDSGLEAWRREPGEVDLHQALLMLAHEVVHHLVFSAPSQRSLAVPLKLATARRAEAKAHRARLEKAVLGLVAARRAAPRDVWPDDLLTHLLSAQDSRGRALTDAQLVDELLTLFAAGHETSANAAGWTLYALARDPALWARAREDARFLAAAVHEALRLYPVIAAAPRYARREVALGGFTLPAGTRLLVSLYLIHRHPAVWRDPEAFVPERFLDASAPRHAYFPFGLGPRACVGRTLALQLVPQLVAHVLERFDFILLGEARPRVAIALYPEGGLRVRLTPR